MKVNYISKFYNAWETWNHFVDETLEKIVKIAMLGLPKTLKASVDRHTINAAKLITACLAKTIFLQIMIGTLALSIALPLSVIVLSLNMGPLCRYAKQHIRNLKALSLSKRIVAITIPLLVALGGFTAAILAGPFSVGLWAGFGALTFTALFHTILLPKEDEDVIEITTDQGDFFSESWLEQKCIQAESQIKTLKAHRARLLRLYKQDPEVRALVDEKLKEDAILFQSPKLGNEGLDSTQLADQWKILMITVNELKDFLERLELFLGYHPDLKQLVEDRLGHPQLALELP